MTDHCPNCKRPYATGYSQYMLSSAPLCGLDLSRTECNDSDALLINCLNWQVYSRERLLEAYRSLAKAADAMCAEYRDCAWSTDTQSAYDTARATVANLDRSTPATTEQKAAAGKGAVE